jgi:hypothetical protein
MSDDEKTAQAQRDEQRQHLHFQVRLDTDLAMSLRHFMRSRGYNANQALTIIISQFFRNKKT